MPSDRDTPEAIIRSIAARQHGVVARSQLLDKGVAAHTIDYRARRGRLRPVHRGVYAVGPVAGPRQAEFAAVLACGHHVALSHLSAAAVTGILSRTPSAPVEVSTPRDVRVQERGIRVHRVARLDADEVSTRDGLPVTTPARTLLDLAGRLGPAGLERAVGRAFREGLVEPAELRLLMDRHPRRPGRGALRALLARADGPAFTRSEAERRFLDLVRSGKLPAPAVNAPINGLEVDFLWRKERLIVEVDGRAYHSNTPAFETDRGRDGALVAAGWRVMRVTWRQIVDEPRPLLVRLALALGAARR